MSDAAVNKIMKLHAAEVAEHEHPHHYEKIGNDPLHTDHKEHIVHKQVAHGHPHGAGNKDAPKDGAK